MWRELQADDPRLVGPYRLRGLLGTGGMGRVFLGVSPGGRPVAVKVIRADLAADAEFRARFQREISVARTVTGLVVGSPGFMSPEQAEGGEVGPPSDIFSLGAVLAYAATGAGPFGGGSTPALVYRVVHTPASLDHVPAEVRPLIERCLAKDPGQRPVARDLLAEAGAVQPEAGWLPEPVTRAFLQLPAQADGPETVTSMVPAAPPGRQERRPRRRLRRPLVIASMVAGLLAASAGGSWR
jgi:eukaryotic-like serine/threonine-protein kinase